MTVLAPTRTPVVPNRRTPLGEAQRAIQIQKGLYIVERGVPLALPLDDLKTPNVFMGQDFWRRTGIATHRKGARPEPFGFAFQRKFLEWANKNISPEFSYRYYLATLGHDIHVSMRGDLYGNHWHIGWADPFTKEAVQTYDPTGETLWKTHPELAEYCKNTLPGERGFSEALGWLCGAKVTDAFVSEEVDELVSTTGTEFADFDFHEVGTSSTAENNDHTALQTTSGIARATGTPTDADPIYRNVGTVTADATETWEEHGIFNNSSGAAMMDRNLTGGQSVVSSDQVQYTYELTLAPEA